ncbi:MAG: cysteine--tRNA ligase [Patescibacteria group bacterium]
MDIHLYNTLTRSKELFHPLAEREVFMYHCGPTVYDYAHIGNLRAYIFADVLRKMFVFNKYVVKQVINITDVGHLTSDEDEGEDKLEAGARREGKTAKEIAAYYTDAFLADLSLLNIDTTGTLFPKASEHIAEQIELIKTLEKKGAVYTTSDGVYFDTSTYEHYGQLARLNIAGLKEGARVLKNPEKRNSTDFALWKFSKPEEKRQQEWDSPWGVGFPGWHLECSAMSMKYLGVHFDIHTGGIDHIPVHHTNEIAQSETATGERFVNYWMHTGFVNILGEKMAKSGGNFITLKTLKEKGYSPFGYRYWLLTADYKKTINFTWEAQSGAQTALGKLYALFVEYGKEIGRADKDYAEKFHSFINSDLDTPRAIALLWELVKDITLSPADKKATIVLFDEVLGLNIANQKPDEIPEEIIKLAREREQYRKDANWQKSDELRTQIESLGYEIKDTDTGARIYKGY